MPYTLLYGGTFDPIHHGHLITCLMARELLAAERVLFIPARISPHKLDTQTGATAQQRLEMIRLAIAPVPGLAVDDRELSRAGPSYTVDTVEALRREQPTEQFTLLIGADQLPKLHTWHRILDLIGPAGIGVAVLPRAHETRAKEEQALAAAGTQLGLQDRLGGCLLDTPRIDISATDIRRRAALGLPVDFLVPPAVASYIRQNGLYKGLDTNS